MTADTLHACRAMFVCGHPSECAAKRRLLDDPTYCHGLEARNAVDSYLARRRPPSGPTEKLEAP